MSSAVDNLADNLASASIPDPSSTANDTVLASAAEGRRLYIGNLAYATTEGELKEFFSAYKVCVESLHRPIPCPCQYRRFLSSCSVTPLTCIFYSARLNYVCYSETTSIPV